VSQFEGRARRPRRYSSNWARGREHPRLVTDPGVKSGYLSEIFVSFQGEGAHIGERHLFVRLAGCHLRCRYCDTPDSLERSASFVVHSASGATQYANPVSPQMVAELVRSLLAGAGPVDAISLTGGEPLTQARFLADFLSTARFALPVLLETSGTLPRQLGEILPYIDIVSMDIKLPSNTGEPDFWEEHRTFLRLAANKALYVKILVDDSTSDGDFMRALQLLDGDRGLAVFLQPILDTAGRPTIALANLDRLHSLARTSLDRVRVLPQIHKVLGIP